VSIFKTQRQKYCLLCYSSTLLSRGSLWKYWYFWCKKRV